MIHSLHGKIKLIFIITALLLTALFGASIYIKHKDSFADREKRYMQTSLFVLRHFRDHNNDIDDPNLKRFLKTSDFKLVVDEKKREKVFTDAHMMFKKRVFRSHFRVFRERKQLYLNIKNRKINILLKDLVLEDFPLKNLVIYLLSLGLLLVLYLWIVRSLKPLKSLQKEIEKFAGGDLQISCKSDKKDEIALVANEFDKAAKTIEKLLSSRQLFLRTIMHELKTPIAKGKIISGMLEDDSYHDSLESVFIRLELLLEEFSKIEQMLSSGYKLELKNYKVLDIVEQAEELLLLEENQVEIIADKPVQIHSDFTLLSLAIKNLIDNGIKYSPDKKVTIKINEGAIMIVSRGEKLPLELNAYFEAFHQQSRHQNAGLGLGLYIVKNIIDLLDLGLEYQHQKEMNTFTITFV